MAPIVPFMRTLYPPYGARGPVPGGDDVIAVKRAVSRAGYYPWRRFNNSYNEEFAKVGIRTFQEAVGLTPSGIYGKVTHEKLRAAHSKAKPGEWAFDTFSIKLITDAIAKEQATQPIGRAREMLEFCRQFEGPYIYGGQHDGSFLNDNPQDGFDCSSSTSYVLWKFGLLGSTQPQVSSWFETWGESGRGKYITVHANDDHVWMEFSLPEGYFRFDTSPHGDGPRGPRVRTGVRSNSGFIHRHPKDM
jgi:Putative peptidoglycan binding domain